MSVRNSPQHSLSYSLGHSCSKLQCWGSSPKGARDTQGGADPRGFRAKAEGAVPHPDSSASRIHHLSYQAYPLPMDTEAGSSHI